MPSARLHLHPLPTISVIVPVHNRLAELEECLESLQSWRPEGCELILVDDASTEDVSKIAERYGALYLRTQRQEGPASARNLGAHHASGDILVFVDADVVVSAETFRIIRGEFHQHPDLAALFGSYDDEPRYSDFFSSFKNLLHHHVHQASRSEAVTFWSGCGAIRKRAFESVGGFNAAQYPTPSIEDIELGIRLIQQRERVRLIKGLQVKHLKKWTLGSLVRTDVFQRAIPWTQLILQTGRMPQDLNLTWASRLSAALVAAIAVVTLDLAAKAHGLSRWSLRDLAAIFVFASILLVLNLDLYRLFWRKRGVRFTVRAIGIHWAYFLYSGAAFLFCCMAGPFRARVRPPTASLDLNVLAKARINKRT
jgi:glycosyltransferase involved in cell wall biosynthesis